MPQLHEAGDWKSLGLSFLLHVLLVTILLLLITTQRTPSGNEPDRVAGIVLTNPDSRDQKFLDETDLIVQEKQTPASAASLAEAALDAPELSLPVPDRANLNGPAIDPTQLDANAMAIVPNTGKPESQGLSKEHLDLIEADRKLIESRRPKGPPASISVFGSGQLSGQSFLFLLDRSKSMGGGGLGVIQAARTELSNAINQLEPYHQFQVLGYHSQTFPMLEKNLIPASDANKDSVPEFIGNLSAFGSTNHLNAVLIALAYKPDVIVLLTDGGLPELNEGQLKRIQRASNQAEIHCIQFGRGARQDEVNFMTLMAGQNRGTFRYVDVGQWEKDK